LKTGIFLKSGLQSRFGFAKNMVGMSEIVTGFGYVNNSNFLLSIAHVLMSIWENSAVTAA